MPEGEGVLVVMNDSIHAAHSLTKTSTTSVETFLSPVRGLVGVASYGKNDFYFKPEWKHTTQSEFDISQVTPDAARRHHLRICRHAGRPDRRSSRRRRQRAS